MAPAVCNCCCDHPWMAHRECVVLFGKPGRSADDRCVTRGMRAWAPRVGPAAFPHPRPAVAREHPAPLGIDNLTLACAAVRWRHDQGREQSGGESLAPRAHASARGGSAGRGDSGRSGRARRLRHYLIFGRRDRRADREKLMKAIDDYVEEMTGDRTRLHAQNHKRG